MNSDFLHHRLEKRKEQGLLRSLKVHAHLIDFCSNDYLGFSRSVKLKQEIENYLKNNPQQLWGATGSRLLSGNSFFIEELESFIANFHHAEAGLIFNSGYDANIGLFSCIAQRGDLIFYDELIHASVHDGMRLSKAESIAFNHNDVFDLEKKLSNARNKDSVNQIFVAVESLYSMDGDLAFLNEMVACCEKFNANLIVDEAHATGVIGNRGEGLVQLLGMEEKIFARLHTFGKALGCHGAIIHGNKLLREYLINFAKAFIYSTALPFHALASVKCAYHLLADANEERNKLNELIAVFQNETIDVDDCEILKSNSPIQGIVVPGNERCKAAAIYLQEQGFDVRPILSPTVPRGKERLRICIHAYNTDVEIRNLMTLFRSFQKNKK